MMKFISAAFSLLLSLQIYGQSLSNYSSVRNTGISYASISGSGNTIGSWRNTAASMLDDNRSDFIDIGFDFWYNGARYTQFCVSTNGFIDFSSNTDDGGAFADDFGYDNTAFTNSNVANFTQLAIAALYDDLAAPSAATSLGTVVKYALSGSSPSRTLTVEWINMRYSGNSTPSLNFQVQLVESSGQILVNYGSMSAGTQVFSYCTGLNASTMSTPPTAAQLKELQAANGNSFSNSVQNNLASLPASSSQYIFSPVVPTPTAGTLSFSGVSTTSLTMNWTNWAANEIGYVIYNSTDGINYSFVSQTAANATSGAVTGLLPGTSYYWKLYAVTEGCLSSAISGTQATNAAGNKTSNGSGNWSAANTWSPNGVPGAGDNVTIAAGHVVQINVSTAQCNSLTINGTLEYNNGGTPYSFTVNNNTTIGSTGTFWVPYNSNSTSTVTFKGNIVNNGVLSFSSDPTSAARAYFYKNGNVTVSGTGSSSFATIYMDLGSTNTNTLEISTPNFLSQTNFLTIQNGIFKLSSTNVATIVPCTTQVSLNKVSGFWLNAPNTTCSFSAGIDLAGKLTVTGGTMNIGNASNEDLQSTGATVSLSTGAINIAGKFYNSGTSNCRFSINSGAFNVSTVGSANTSYAPFHLNGSSTFTMSGGLIGVINEGGSGAQDLGYNNTASGSMTGGTLQLGNAATLAGSTMQVIAPLGAGNFIVNSSNVTAKLMTNSLTVLNNITLSGNLFANNLNISLGGNWTNNGGAFTPGTNTVYFNGNTAQNIFKTGGENFNGLDFSNAGIKTFSSAITASSGVVINSGATADVGTANNQLTVKGNFVNNGTFTSRSGLVLFDGTSSQNIGGSSLTSFYDITLNNNSGASLTGSVNLIDALNLNNGTLNVNGQQLTMVSTATATARISQITGSGDVNGNVNVQRFVPGGTTGWANFGTCISSGLTFADWDDDFAITCPNCPDGYYNFTW